MIKNYCKIVWRNMLNHKAYSALNIIGLAIGMGVALLIGLWVVNEYSYDRFLPGYKQLYQVELNYTLQKSGKGTQNAISIPVAEVLRKNYPEIKHVAVSDWMGPHALLVGDKKLYIKGASVESDFLKMFRYPLIKGDANSVLQDPYSIVLTESTAKALFGQTDPMNKTIKIDNKHYVKVTGIMKNVPLNSTLQFNYILPFSYSLQTEEWIKNASTQWNNNPLQIFVELQANASYAQLAPKIKNILYDNSPQMRDIKPEIILHPLSDWHLYSEFREGKAVGGFIEYTRMFSVTGILVLLIACINFMNLATARSEKRAREVGIRKAIGSRRIDLIIQFLTESVIITFIASLLSILLVQLALPSFNALTGSSINIPYKSCIFWSVMIAYVLITGLLAGSRPAFYLSSFNPVKVLKGGTPVGKYAAIPRKALVVIQFSCSIVLIISTIVIYQQIQHVKNRPVGYSSERLVTTEMSSDLVKNYDALKNNLLQSGAVESLATTSSSLTAISNHQSIERWPGKTAPDQAINSGGISVSDNYFQTVGMKFIMGRNFSNNYRDDSLNIIINEAAVKRMGLKNPINQTISFNGVNGPARIIGVVQDALMGSPFAQAEPTVFNRAKEGNFLIYRLSATVTPHEAIQTTGKIFNTYNPAYPYSYHFADEEYNHKFKLEMLAGKLAGIFACLAIFISCLGLFGLAAYIAEQRSKEIGIRKVLGASVASVWFLLSSDFIILVIISCLIASPVALYFLQNWLQHYEYHVNINFGVFVISAVAILLITILTISFQAIRAALANPVKSLKAE
ncbi:MAG: ABC transporter permease [Mucilaginibacter sp.]|uniref:ABC transporter permease n=1 Tax=Mucilaginibacter sp. TaxID=1882438 RepID=UPI0031B37666